MPTTYTVISDIIQEELDREGPATNDPNDKGGPTAFGISKAANPQAWVNGPPTEQQARTLYFTKYVKGPGFDKITGQTLQAQLVDFGVNSGPHLAIMKLQLAVGIAADGILGPETLAAISKTTNNKLVALRVKMIGSIVQRDPSQIKYLSGWLSRALEFLE